MLTTPVLVVLAVCSTALADITGSNPPSGTCLCISGRGVRIRSQPLATGSCGTSELGQVSTGRCFISKGRKQNCRLGSRSHEFFLLNYNGGDGWTAGSYLSRADPTRCGASRGGGATTGLTQGQFTSNCMKCICEVEGCDSQIGKCRWDVNSNSCGPYQIKNGYFTDCKPGARITEDWETCTKQKACSERCVGSYMARYGTAARCPNGPTCREFARLHNGGPSGCKHQSNPNTERNLEAYWAKVKRCCDRIGGC